MYKQVLTILILFMAIGLSAQITISGKVVDENGEPIIGMTIWEVETTNGVITGLGGIFEIDVLNEESVIEFSLHHCSIRQKIEKTRVFNISTTDLYHVCKGLNKNLLSEYELLTEVTIIPEQQSSSTVTQLTRPTDLSLSGTADILSNAPGIFADASTGEVFSRVFSRGVSLSAEDDIGWFYNSLQEDGLPITMVNYNQFSPDLFHRPDLSISQVEIFKGGKSGILAANSPGTVVNFIGRTPSNNYQSETKITTGLHQNGRAFLRLEGYSGGKFNDSNWGYDVSYWIRRDQGNRDIDYNLSEGVQAKLGLYRYFDNGIISLKSKILNDQTNRYTGVAATDWDNPVPAFGQSFQNTSLLVREFAGEIPDGRTLGASSYEFNPSNGIQTDEWNATLSADFQWTDWRLQVDSKISLKSANWQTSIGGQPLGLDNFLTYFISGDQFPVGLVEFLDTETGQSIATVNNAGILNAFQGMTPTFDYVSGSLPNDAILGSGAWYKDDQVNDWINDVSMTWNSGDLNWTIGAFGSRSTVDAFTNASFIYATYEPEPQGLEVRLTDFDGNQRNLSDGVGLSNYGALLYEEGDININIFSLYSQLTDYIYDKLHVDISARYDLVQHRGLKYNSAPIEVGDGGLDGNPSTSFDNGLLGRAGSDAVDFDYDFLSWSAGASYELDYATNLYARLSNTHKSPELNYYLNNFSNVPIDGPGAVQDIFQAELGVKRYNFTITGFYSSLSNVPYSNFEFDQQTNTIFYEPTQFNSSRTIGLELEYRQRINSQFSIDLNATLQDAQLVDFTLYQSNGTVEISDDSVISLDNREVPHQANLSGNINLNYSGDRFDGRLTYRYVGNRFGNLENSFTLPAYGRWDASVKWNVSNRWYLSVLGTNLFNSAGLNNFFGPNQFGSNADAATAEFIENNPDASFVVFPISGRTVSLSVGYRI